MHPAQNFCLIAMATRLEHSALDEFEGDATMLSVGGLFCGLTLTNKPRNQQGRSSSTPSGLIA